MLTQVHTSLQHLQAPWALNPLSKGQLHQLVNHLESQLAESCPTAPELLANKAIPDMSCKVLEKAWVQPGSCGIGGSKLPAAAKLPAALVERCPHGITFRS